jgi:hypothetical protein
MQRWLKLVAEDAENTKILAKRRMREKSKNKNVKSVRKHSLKK